MIRTSLFTASTNPHRGKSTTEATGQHELGGVQSPDGGQPHGAAQGARRLPVLLGGGGLSFIVPDTEKRIIWSMLKADNGKRSIKTRLFCHEVSNDCTCQNCFRPEQWL